MLTRFHSTILLIFLAADPCWGAIDPEAQGGIQGDTEELPCVCVAALERQPSPVSSLAWSLADQLAVGGSKEDTNIRLWDLDVVFCSAVLEEHTSRVTSVAWSPAGQLASGSGDNTVRLWDLHTRSSVAVLEGHTSRVTSVAWSPAGQLASGSLDQTVRLWDPEHPKELITKKGWFGSSVDRDYCTTIFEGQADSILSVAWSPTGRLASGGGWRNSAVCLWDLRTPSSVITLEGHTDQVNSVAWSPTGQLASGSGDNTVRLWDLRTRSSVAVLEGHRNSVHSIAWSPTGQLASAGGDTTVRLWDLGTNSCASVLCGHPDDIYSITWSPTGPFGEFRASLASGGLYGVARLWGPVQEETGRAVVPQTKEQGEE